MEDLLQTTNVGAISADRFWLTVPILTQDATVDGRPRPPATARVVLPTVWDPVPAGSAPLACDELRFPVTDAAPGRDGGAAGEGGGRAGIVVPHHGRSRRLPRLEPGLLHLLAPGAISTSAAELDAMVAGFNGPQTGTPAGTTVHVVAATLTPQAAGLQLRLLGDRRVQRARRTCSSSTTR